MSQILIIDDEPQVRSLLKQMLEQEGYSVTVASDGIEGLERFHKRPSDLIITDLVMPEQEGLETIRLIRKDNPDVPIFAISGGGKNSAQSYLDLAKLIGANVILKKPIDQKVLIDEINNVFMNQG